MHKMKRFLMANMLTMNESKTTITEVMVPQKRAKQRGSPPQLETKNQKGEREIVRASEYTRILGFNLQDNLSLKAHICTGEK